MERETVEIRDWDDDFDMDEGVELNTEFQQEQVAEEINQRDSAVENNQQENIQQDQVADENVQVNSAEEEIQRDNVAEEQVADEEFQQEPLDVEPLAKGNDEVCIPEVDLINLSEDIAKFNSWRRIRHLSILDFNAAVNEDSERLQELELWALEFSKDLPAENLSDRLISKFVKKLEKLKVNLLRKQMRAKIAETKRKAEIAKLKVKEVLLESDEVLEKARKKAEKKTECSDIFSSKLKIVVT